MFQSRPAKLQKIADTEEKQPNEGSRYIISDVDNTISAFTRKESVDGQEVYFINEKHLSPYVINLIKESRCDGIYYCTHRSDVNYETNIQSLMKNLQSMQLVQRGFASKQSPEEKEAYFKALPGSFHKLLFKHPEFKGLTFNLEDCLTFKIIKNVTEITGVPCLGVSVPGSGWKAKDSGSWHDGARLIKNYNKVNEKENYENYKRLIADNRMILNHIMRYELYLMFVDDLADVTEALKLFAKSKNIPILIQMKDEFHIYGCPTMDNNWQLTAIHPEPEIATHLNGLPFDKQNKIPKRFDGPFERILVTTIKKGHALYGRADINFKSMLEMDLTSKNDQFKTLIEDIARSNVDKATEITILDDVKKLCLSAASELQDYCNEMSKKYGGVITLKVIWHSAFDNTAEAIPVLGTAEYHPVPQAVLQQAPAAATKDASGEISPQIASKKRRH